MADQGKWFKLWESSLDDFDLENLTIHEWYCWARFGVYMKKHGRDGKIRLREPATALVNLFRVPTFKEALRIIKVFPNYTVGERNTSVSPETIAPVSYEVESQNWHKYQGDFSSNRVRRFRDQKRRNETLQEERRRRQDVDKTRGEVTPSPLPPQAGAPTSKVSEWFEKTWREYPKERRVGKKAAFRSYQKAVKDLDGAKVVAVALDNYLASQTVKDGFIKNASTFFANYEDYKNDSGTSSAGVRGDGNERYGNRSDAGSGVEVPANRELQRLANRTHFPGKPDTKGSAH